MFTLPELEKLADMIADRLRGPDGLPARVAAHDVPRRMPVALFAVCVAKCPEVVKRRIRSRRIDPRHVERSAAGFLVDRAALEKFNVPLDLAAERLAAWRQAQAASPAQTPAPGARMSPA